MTKIFAHRGASGTHPENTMVAFVQAEKEGADGIECDIQMTKDGQLVIIHDETLDRTTNGHGNVKDYTYKELKKFHAGYKFGSKYGFVCIPTLNELFEWLSGNTLACNIELKGNTIPYTGMEEKLIQQIRKWGLETRMILSSFNHYSLVHCYRLDPEMETAPLYRDALFMPWIYAASIGARGMHPNMNVAPASVITAAIDAGIKVRPYTVNMKEKMKALFSINCSALITDYPGRAVKLRRQIR
ncbi:glycerophosphodiester phosphodiesterase [Peribacillus sp. SCS-155]|uniref:glycerophosphodiester phosphodiesterase n=1 Tax=Peribacillus sedimenti TaxID=3115297 RepID=UPI003906ACFA